MRKARSNPRLEVQENLSKKLSDFLKTFFYATGFGIWSSLSSLVGSKQLSAEDVAPVINKMQDHLIAKNVAADVARNLCKSVANRLEGKVMGKTSVKKGGDSKTEFDCRNIPDHSPHGEGCVDRVFDAALDSKT